MLSLGILGISSSRKLLCHVSDHSNSHVINRRSFRIYWAWLIVLVVIIIKGIVGGPKDRLRRSLLYGLFIAAEQLLREERATWATIKVKITVKVSKYFIINTWTYHLQAEWENDRPVYEGPSRECSQNSKTALPWQNSLNLGSMNKPLPYTWHNQLRRHRGNQDLCPKHSNIGATWLKNGDPGTIRLSILKGAHICKL